MHTSPTTAQTATVATARTSLIDGQYLLLGLVGIVTWLALIGGALGMYIIRDAPFVTAFNRHLHVNYAAFDLTQSAPTSFGSLRITALDHNPASTETTIPADRVLVNITVEMTNDLDVPVSLPRFDDVRMVYAEDDDVQRLPVAEGGSTVVNPHSTGSLVASFLAPREGGLLWLEYRNVDGHYPLRFALGTPDALYTTAGTR